MRIVTGLLVTLGSCLLVEADSEAFFLPNLLSRSGSRGSRQIARPQPRPRPIRQTQFRHAPHVSHHNRHVQPPRPIRQTKAIFGNQHSLRPQNAHPHHGAHGRNNKFVRPPRSDPGAKMKLDFGGWKPINFDEDLPSKLKRGIKISDFKSVSDSVNSGKIVTIDTAIARAPEAESDPAPRGPASPAPQPHRPPVSQVSHIRIPSTADHNSIIYVDSSDDPIYSLLDANNPAVAPKYKETSKPVFQSPQYIPRPAVPSKPIQPRPQPQQPAVAPRYQPQAVPALPPQYDPAPAPALPPPYERPVSVSYEPASFVQSSAPLSPAPAPAYQPEQVAYPVVSQLPAKTPGPAPDTEQYPVVALITADSEVPEEEKFVQFSITGGSPGSLPLLSEPLGEPSPRKPKDVAKESDELYYIYYQDPALDPSFGVKSERDARQAAPAGLDIPLYDYDEVVEDLFRTERDQPSYAGRTSSRVSFRQNVGGKKSGFTYKLS